MAVTADELVRAFSHLEIGEAFEIIGGHIPPRNDTCEAVIGLEDIFSIKALALRDRSTLLRPNNRLAELGIDSIAVELSRGEATLGFDYDSPDFRYGKGVGHIVGVTVDLIAVDGKIGTAYFVCPTAE